jgi:hypothetical protein
MPTDPRTDEEKKKQANEQIFMARLLSNTKKILTDMLIIQSIASQIINIVKRFSIKAYREKLRAVILEKIFRRPRLVDTGTAEALAERQKKEEKLPVSMLPSAQETPPTKAVPEEKQKMLGFSRFFSRRPSKKSQKPQIPTTSRGRGIFPWPPKPPGPKDPP